MPTQKTVTHAEGGVHASRPNVELWNRETVCAFFGGDRPLNHATLYRGIASGRFPRPVNISANLVRWVADECRAALAAIIARRDAGERTPSRNGGCRAKDAA